MTPQGIIDKGDEILYSNSDLDRRIYKRLIKFLAQSSKEGKVSISNEELAALEDIIYDEIKKSDYEENIGNYLKLLTSLENSISEQQYDINRIKAQNIKDLWRGNDLRTRLVDKVVYDLGQAGIKNYFVRGLAEVVRNQNFFNLTIDDAVDQLQRVLIDDNYTQRYVRGVAKDALRMYGGAINDAVAEAYELGDILYIGNTIETTRPVCAHLRDTLKGRITKEQLIKTLNEYCPNGVPSQEYITYTTVSGETHRKKKGSGMFEGTRYENFRTMVGGHECRHEAVPTDLSRKR